METEKMFGSLSPAMQEKEQIYWVGREPKRPVFGCSGSFEPMWTWLAQLHTVISRSFPAVSYQCQT